LSDKIQVPKALVCCRKKRNEKKTFIEHNFFFDLNKLLREIYETGSFDLLVELLLNNYFWPRKRFSIDQRHKQHESVTYIGEVLIKI
jgi:hypothetical protein